MKLYKVGYGKFGHVEQSVRESRSRPANNTGTARKVSLCQVIFNFSTNVV